MIKWLIIGGLVGLILRYFPTTLRETIAEFKEADKAFIEEYLRGEDDE